MAVVAQQQQQQQHGWLCSLRFPLLRSPHLLLRRQRGVQRQDDGVRALPCWQPLQPVSERSHGSLDLLLPRQEHEDVTRLRARVNVWG